MERDGLRNATLPKTHYMKMQSTPARWLPGTRTAPSVVAHQDGDEKHATDGPVITITTQIICATETASSQAILTKPLCSINCDVWTILFYSRLCPSTAGCAIVLHLSLSFAVLVHTAPCCQAMQSLQRRFGLPTDLTSFVCHSMLLIVHLLSFIRAMCPAHFHFVLVDVWTGCVCVSVISSLQWTSTLKDGQVIYACSGQDVTIPWSFSLSPDEEINSMEWLYR